MWKASSASVRTAASPFYRDFARWDLREKEFLAYVAELEGKGQKEKLAAFVLRTEQGYRQEEQKEVKKLVACALECDEPVVIVELLRLGASLLKACADEWQLRRLVELGEQVLGKDMRAGVAFLRTSAAIIGRDRNADLKRWAERGLALGKEELADYFAGSTKASQDALGYGRQRAVELSQVASSFRVFARAVSGKPMAITSTPDTPRTDGVVIYLPERIDEFPERDLNRKQYRALTVHEARHAKESFIINLGKVNLGRLGAVK